MCKVFSTYYRKGMAKKEKQLEENFLSHVSLKLNQATKSRKYQKKSDLVLEVHKYVLRTRMKMDIGKNVGRGSCALLSPKKKQMIPFKHL